MKIKRARGFRFLQIRALVALALFAAAICLAKFSLTPTPATKSAPERNELDRSGRYMPVLGGGADDLNRMEEEWNNRLTYPTGLFDPTWVRSAAVQDSAMRRAIPAGLPLRDLNQTGSPLALSPTGFTALGPAPLN